MNIRLFFNISLTVSILTAVCTIKELGFGYGVAAGIGAFIAFLILAFFIGLVRGKDANDNS